MHKLKLINSKILIVFDPLVTGHVIRRMRSGTYAYSMVINGKRYNS